MDERFEVIVSHLVAGTEETGPLTGFAIEEQFRPHEKTREATLRNLNAAFLISLCGKTHPLYSKALSLMENLEKQPPWEQAARFYKKGLSLVEAEIRTRCSEDEGFRQELDDLYSWLGSPPNLNDRRETLNKTWRVFFPEGVSLFENRAEEIAALRKRRGVRITRLNPRPIQDPAGEILFASNVLLTLPSPSMGMDGRSLLGHFSDPLDMVKEEPQRYWYDHPIPMGIEPGANEVLYGLKGLDGAMAFEKDRGIIKSEERLQCVLSVSVTHEGLKDLAKPYLEHTFKQAKGFPHLQVFAFTETDTQKIIAKVLEPGVLHYFGKREGPLLSQVFGVDGEYGRHYSFLKAVSGLWQVVYDSRIRATFKIDLDQVFPQEKLLEETGASAFEQLMTPLWGAEGVEEGGNPVELGMIAGALVSQKHANTSLFTPDVEFPDEDIHGDEWIFFSPLPQALSTEAEMMTRYADNVLNGREGCIQRVHVTGGTCGILVDSLRRHRPFTPTFMGRAEDQAYLLSVLFHPSERNLRYVHKNGLIMRHDKEAFARESIEASHLGKLVGDYARILLFSYYVRGLPWPVHRTKGFVDPFTGCFVSHLPLTVVYLRLTLKGASFFSEGRESEGFRFLNMGTRRIGRLVQDLTQGPNPLKEQYEREERAWNLFYGLLDRLEKGLAGEDSFSLELKYRAKEVIKDTEINI
jgi:hypothetical protein